MKISIEMTRTNYILSYEPDAKYIYFQDSSVDAVLRNGRNILHYASDYGQVEIVRYMCERKADINVSPLTCAIILYLVTTIQSTLS